MASNSLPLAVMLRRPRNLRSILPGTERVHSPEVEKGSAASPRCSKCVVGGFWVLTTRSRGWKRLNTLMATSNMLAADIPERRSFSGAVPNVQDFYCVVENLETDLVGVMSLAVQNSSDLNFWTPRKKLNGDRRAT